MDKQSLRLSGRPPFGIFDSTELLIQVGGKMKRFILVAVFLACLGLAATSAAAPVAKLVENSVDVGQVLEGQYALAVFWVDNSGDAALEIQKVSPG